MRFFCGDLGSKNRKQKIEPWGCIQVDTVIFREERHFLFTSCGGRHLVVNFVTKSLPYLSASFDRLEGVLLDSWVWGGWTSCGISKPAAAAAAADWLLVSSEEPIEFRPLRLLLVDRLETRFRFNISLSLIGAVSNKELIDLAWKNQIIWKRLLD